MICPHCNLEDRGGLHSAQFCIERLAEVIHRVPITGGMIRPRDPVDHDAYRRGLCCDCSVAPCSAGRPRCGPCHTTLVDSRPVFEPRAERDKLAACAAHDCRNPTVPGKVLCAPCTRARTV